MALENAKYAVLLISWKFFIDETLRTCRHYFFIFLNSRHDSFGNTEEQVAVFRKQSSKETLE